MGSYGNDWLEGGAGNDLLWGRSGDDVFVLNLDDTGVDIVTDFSRGGISGDAGLIAGGDDKIQIETASGNETYL